MSGIMILPTDLLNKLFGRNFIVGWCDSTNKERLFYPKFGRLCFLDRSVFIWLNYRSFLVLKKI